MTNKQHKNRRENSQPKELEVALLILSENPDVVAKQIAGLTSIANYILIPQDTQRIRDIYFDTPDKALESQKIALRVREIKATCWITFKGPSKVSEWGGVKRTEIELPWSKEALDIIVKELRSRGIKLLQPSKNLANIGPLDTISSLGMEVVQDRETYRQIRNLTPLDDESQPALAELAIDSVNYQFGNQQICLHEVEIEAKTKNGSIALKAVIESLLGRYEHTFQKWIHSKLATGEAIEKLLSEGALQGLIDLNNNLKPAAFKKIDDYLSRGGV